MWGLPISRLIEEAEAISDYDMAVTWASCQLSIDDRFNSIPDVALDRLVHLFPEDVIHAAWYDPRLVEEMGVSIIRSFPVVVAAMVQALHTNAINLETSFGQAIVIAIDALPDDREGGPCFDDLWEEMNRSFLRHNQGLH